MTLGVLLFLRFSMSRAGGVSGSRRFTFAPAIVFGRVGAPAPEAGGRVVGDAGQRAVRRPRAATPRVACGLVAGGMLVLGTQSGANSRGRLPAAIGAAGLRAAVQQAVGASDRAFWPARRGVLLVSSGGGIVSSFGDSGVTLRAPVGTVKLRLTALGYGARPAAVPEVAPVAAGDSVRFPRPGLVEWYRNGPFGLEQGFTLQARPRGSGGPLTIELSVGGSLRARGAGAGIAFVSGTGAVGVSYGGLSVTDASGRRLRARLVPSAGRLLVRVWDRGARYPLRVDPFLQEGPKFTGSGAKGPSEFGISVALSADGKTALVGGSNDDSLLGALEELPVHSQSLGAAWVFTRTRSGWSQQGTKLLPTGERGPGSFGASVALSADGRLALIGGPSGYGGVGAAWVFARSGSTWHQLAKLTPNGLSSPTGYVTDPDGFGASVALSALGTVILVGGPAAHGGRGSTWIFARSGSTWKQQGAELTGRGEMGTGQFGAEVALSGSGDVAVIGGPFDDEGVGAAWVFRRVGAAWRQQGEKLVGRGEAGFGRFGSSIALSAAATTALIGAPVDGNGSGAVWTFSPAAAGWTQEGAKLTAKNEIGAGQFGDRVAISSSGTTALVGAALDRAEVGAAWVFRRAGSGWAQEGPKLIGRGEAGQGQFGVAVALSAAGGTALIGGLGDNSFVGAAWAFQL